MASHELFKRYPLAGTQQVSTGQVPIPYHVYDGTVLFIGGTAELSAVQNLTRGETVRPLETSDHRALVGLWICDFKDASLGPHLELQCSVFVSRQPHAPVPAHPLAILKLISLQPETLMLCYQLWNTTETVVAYNRELLGLDAAFTVGHFTRRETTLDFSFADSSGKPILRGNVYDPQRPDLSGTLALMRVLGFSGMMQAARAPWISVKVVNPISSVIPYNGEGQTFTSSARQRVRLVDPSRNHIEFGDVAFNGIHFMPQFMTITEGCKFVYLHPQKPI